MTTFSRTALTEFDFANAIYAGATVSAFTVDASGNPTTTLAPLYADLTSATLLGNPQVLDGNGQWQQPVYITAAVVLAVTGVNGVPDHQTGVISANLAGSSASDAAASANAAQASFGMVANILARVSSVYNRIKRLSLPLTLTALDYLRVNAAGTGYELRTPSQVRADISLVTGTPAQVDAATAGIVPTADQLTNRLRGLIQGFETGAPGGAATLTIGPGVCVDNTNTDVLLVASIFTKTMSAWAVGSGNGGLDTGAVATSTPYFVWVIQRPDTGVIDYLISLSGTAPTMPANYTVKRGPIAWFKTDGSSHIWKFQQRGDSFIFGAPVLDVNGDTSLSNSQKLYTLSLPAGFVVDAYISAAATNSGSTQQYDFYSPDENSSIGATMANGGITVLNSAAGTSGVWKGRIRSNTSAQVAAVSNAAANNTANVTTIGFDWTRGRNS